VRCPRSGTLYAGHPVHTDVLLVNSVSRRRRRRRRRRRSFDPRKPE